jgi:hypothetical protein
MAFITDLLDAAIRLKCRLMARLNPEVAEIEREFEVIDARSADIDRQLAELRDRLKMPPYGSGSQSSDKCEKSEL